MALNGPFCADVPLTNYSVILEPLPRLSVQNNLVMDDHQFSEHLILAVLE